MLGYACISNQDCQRRQAAQDGTVRKLIVPVIKWDQSWHEAREMLSACIKPQCFASLCEEGQQRSTVWFLPAKAWNCMDLHLLCAGLGCNDVLAAGGIEPSPSPCGAGSVACYMENWGLSPEYPLGSLTSVSHFPQSSSQMHMFSSRHFKIASHIMTELTKGFSSVQIKLMSS